VERLGYLPLAIDQAGSCIASARLPLQLFITRFNERRADLLKATPEIWEYARKIGDSDIETHLSAFTTWELSFQQILEDGMGKESKKTRISDICILLLSRNFRRVFHWAFPRLG